MKTISQRKSYFPEEKQFWPSLSRITEYGRPQAKFCWAPQGKTVIIVQVIRWFAWYLGGCWKHNFLTKKTFFQREKYSGQFFLALSSEKKPQGANYRGIRGRFCDSHCASCKIISLGHTRSMKTISQKKSNFPMKNNIGYFFSRITEYDRPQVTLC